MAKPKAERHPGGRPSLYQPRFCQALIAHAKDGLSFESFAAKCGVCIDTIYEWVKVHPEFSDAKKRHRAISLRWWEERGIEGMTERGFNAGIWIFNMKNRFGWRDSPPEAEAPDESKDEVYKAQWGTTVEAPKTSK